MFLFRLSLWSAFAFFPLISYFAYIFSYSGCCCYYFTLQRTRDPSVLSVSKTLSCGYQRGKTKWSRGGAGYKLQDTAEISTRQDSDKQELWHMEKHCHGRTCRNQLSRVFPRNLPYPLNFFEEWIGRKERVPLNVPLKLADSWWRFIYL